MNLIWTSGRTTTNPQPSKNVARTPTHETQSSKARRDQLNGEDSPIIYNPQYQALICIQHGYAVQNLQAHLRNEHDLSLTQRKVIVAQHQANLVLSVHEFIHPSSVKSAIPGLKKPVRAYQCQDLGCNFVNLNEESVRQHANQKHGWRKSEECPQFWKAVRAQTFFANRQIVKYFTIEEDDDPVDLSEADVEEMEQTSQRISRVTPIEPLHSGDVRVSDSIRLIQQRWSVAEENQEKKLAQLEKDVLKQDRTGWYNRTAWPEHLGESNMRFLAAATRVPDKDEALLKEAVRVVNLVFKQALVGLSTLDLETRRWLRSPKRTEPDVRPMSRLQESDSQDRYTGYWRRFICYCIRVYQAQPRPASSPRSVSATTDRSNASVRTLVRSRSDDDSSGEDDSESESENEMDEEEEEEEEEEGDRDTTSVSKDEVEIDLMADARRLFPWTDQQLYLISELISELSSGGHEEEDDEPRIEKMLQVCRSFIFQSVGGEPFRSALVHFLAVLGIDEENNRLKRAVDYSYILAGVVYCVRLLGVEILLPSGEREEQENEARRELFLEQRQTFLADGSFTPMSTMLSLLAYGKSVAMNTGNSGSILWSQDKKILYFHGRPIEIFRFQSMVQDAVKCAEDMLWKDLMWVANESERFSIPLKDIKDDVSFSKRGVSFISKSSNGLDHGRDWMLQRMESEAPQPWLQRGKWRRAIVKRYLRRGNHFRRLLLFCVHTTGGQPARGTEITSIRFRNGALQDRNVFVIDGQVVIVTRYHKSQSLFDRPKVIPRFLPWRVGQLLAIYLAYVQPFVERLSEEMLGYGHSDFIWFNAQGPWPTDYLTKIIRQETGKGIRNRCTTINYRHIAVSIGRVMVGESFASGFQDEVGEVEEAEVEEEESALEVQAGRGEFMGTMRYGVKVDVVQHLSNRSLETFRPLSRAWHRFLGLHSEHDSVPVPKNVGSGHKREASTTELVNGRARPAWRKLFDIPSSPTPITTMPSNSPINALASSPLPFDKSQDIHVFTSYGTQIESAMHQLFSDGSVTFRSREQEEALYAVLQGATPLVVVLPTGGGKTLLAMIPSLIDREGVTIVVAPFRALVTNMVQRFQAAGIECIEWRHGEVNPATVVIVSADIAVSLGFLSYARLLCTKKMLRRIFLDEGHLTFTSSDWRPKLAQLKVLRSLDCPIVLLSATIPPILEIELADCMLIHNARYIRCSTVRPHHRYHVQHCRRGVLQAQTLQLCRRLGASLVGDQKKGVIYCRTRATCEVMATELSCAHYHAGVIDRAERLEQWSERGGWIVATGALGTGVDFPGILVVVHMGMPYSMIDFTQESGRAGRGDEVVDSFVVIEERSVEDQIARESARMSVDEMAMASFLTSVRCRRAVMSQYLDGTATSCSDIPGGARCDRCGEGVTAWQEWEQKVASGWETVTRALDEMAVGCVACLMMEVDDSGNDHELQQCVRHYSTVQKGGLDAFRELIRWQDKSHSCDRCGLSQKICATGEDVAIACQWPGVMIPVLKVAATQADGQELFRAVGYLGGFEGEEWGELGKWLGRRHSRRVLGEWMSNGMVYLVTMITRGQAEEEEGVEGG